MQRVYVDRKNATIKVEKDRLKVSFNDTHIIQSCPIKQMDTLVLLTKTQLSSTDLIKLNAAGVDVLSIHHRDYSKSSITSAFNHGNYARQFKQYRFIDSPHSVDFARYILELKLLRQMKLLRRILFNRPQQRYQLMQGIDGIQKSLHAIRENQDVTVENKINVLRGLEGIAAKSYFKSYSQGFADIWQFTHRNKRPPRDPVNALLSLGYTLIYNDCVRAIIASGLDPRFGVLHYASYNRQSLACDMMELYRPIYDRVVYRWCAEQVFRLDDFAYTRDACLLTKSARSHFYACFEAKMKPYRRAQIRLARQWQQALSDLSFTKE